MTYRIHGGRRPGSPDSRAGWAAAIIPQFLRGDAQPACSPTTADFFFADGQGSPDYALAKRICATCPLVAECDQWAEQNKERWGIWGGRNRSPRAKPLPAKLKRELLPVNPNHSLRAYRRAELERALTKPRELTA